MAEDTWPQKMLVTVPVADLRREPRDGNGSYDEDPLQETQLLYGESLMAFEEKNGWLRVEALEQPEFTHKDKWEGYPGWIRSTQAVSVADFPPLHNVVKKPWSSIHAVPDKSSKILLTVFLGTKLSVSSTGSQRGWLRLRLPDGREGMISEADTKPLINSLFRRSDILKTAKELLGGPYFWGGRSAHKPDWKDQTTGVDCSGLVNLSHRVNGLDLPRDAHEQYMKSRRVQGSLQPGDLVFLAKPEKPDRMVHVMMVAGRDKLLEAAGQAHRIRIISAKERLGKSLRDIAHGERVGDRVVYFGTYLP